MFTKERTVHATVESFKEAVGWFENKIGPENVRRLRERIDDLAQKAFKEGFVKAKAECLKVVDDWSRACHPVHPKKSQELGSKDKCWSYHGLQAAKRSIKRDVKAQKQKR